MPKNARSRRTTSSKTEIYCRKCMETKSEDNFFSAVDNLLDTNGKMSVCSSCCEEIFQSNYGSTRNLRIAILNTCRVLNVAFSERAIAGVQSRIGKLQREPKSVFGLYKQALAGSANVQGADFNILTFVEPERQEGKQTEEVKYDNADEQEALAYFFYEWGKGRSLEEYEWLEMKMEEWKSTHKCDTTAEKELLKRIVWNQFKTNEAIEKNEPTDGLVKEFRELIKTSGLEPREGASGGKSQETFSHFIKMIETQEPAEVFGDERDAFKDWGNIKWYFNNYIVRSLKNFITGSRDFTIEDEDEDEGFEETDLLDFLSDEEE